MDYFSGSYSEAREKFLSFAHDADARIESHQHPLLGPDNEPLFADVAMLGNENPSRIIVLCSGTHGVEGFAGSAVQSGLLQQGVFSSLAPDLGVMMLHGLNPYGFSHFRRVNEDNVDLNRNFIDHSKAYPSNPGYGKLLRAIYPRSLSTWDTVVSALRILKFTILNGGSGLQQAASGGQYEHAEGIFYGGQFETWSNKLFREIVKQHLSLAKQVVFIDLHTGLGKFGESELILEYPLESEEYERASRWWGDRVKNTIAGESLSSDLVGTIESCLDQLLPNTELTSVTHEFGVAHAMNILWAMRAENWLHQKGSGHKDADKVRKSFIKVFYPDNDQWKHKVWLQGKRVVEDLLAHMTNNDDSS